MKPMTNTTQNIIEKILKGLEDLKCDGYRCNHETSNNHYLLFDPDISEIVSESIKTAREGVVEARSELRAELNRGYWNGIIPQSNKDFLEKFIEHCEKNDLGVLVNRLNKNEKFYSIRKFAEEFLLTLKGNHE